MGPIFWLSLRQLAGQRRLLVVLLLAAVPIVVAVAVSALAGDESNIGQRFTNIVIDGMVVGTILPIVTMVLATTAFGNEVEDRTLSHLAVQPIPRSRIVLPKLLASIVVAGPLLIVSGVVATLLGPEGDGQAAFAVGAALLVGVVVYASIFTWAGLVSNHALGYGLIYVFLWEGIISSYLGGVRYLSVRGYTLATLYGIDEKGFGGLGQRVIDFPGALAGAAAVSGVFFWLTVRRLRRMDIP